MTQTWWVLFVTRSGVKFWPPFGLSKGHLEEAGTQSIVDDGGSVFLKGEKIVYYWDVHGSDRNWFSKLVYKLFTERIQPTYVGVIFHWS